jgi:signal peptidase I
MEKEQNKLSKRFSEARRILKEIGIFLVDILYNAIIIIILVILIRTFLISPFRVVGSSMADNLHSNEFILIDKLSYRLSEPDRGDPVVFKPPITSKYSHKFEEAITTDENGAGVLELNDLIISKSVIYCQNEFIKQFWFCRDRVNEGDLVYFRPTRTSISGFEITWKNADFKKVSKEEINSQQLAINGEANQSYLIRIYSSSGPEYFVKRIIGIPGDTIKIENGRVYLKAFEDDDFTEIEEEYLNQENKNNTFLGNRTISRIYEIPEGSYFLLGDNRNHSNDSRSWTSPIDQDHIPYAPKDNISGKVLIVLWPIQSVRLISSGDI